MGEVTGGEQPTKLSPILDGAGVRAVRLYGRDEVDEHPSEDVLLRADSLVAGLRISTFIDDRQAVGRCYATAYDEDDVADAGFIDIMLESDIAVATTTWFDGAGIGDMRFQVYENVNPVGGVGTPLLVTNVNRFFAATRPARTTMHHSPDFTGGDLGNLIIDAALIGGEKKDAGLVANRNLGSLILLNGVKYLFRLLNASGGPQDQSLGISFVEALMEQANELQQQAAQRSRDELGL